MRLSPQHFIFFITLLFVTSCQIQKHLPKGTFLYAGAKVTVEKVSDFDGKPKPIANALEGIVAPRKNKMLFGFPYTVAIWYAIGEPKKKSGLRYWLRNQFGDAPVLSTRVDIKANESNLQAYLENKGYFKSIVIGKTDTQGYKLKAVFVAKVTRPYVFDTIKWVLDSSELSHHILRIKRRGSYVKRGAQFDIGSIQAERNRIDMALKERGFYFFNPDFIKAYLDTNNNEHKIKVFMTIKKETPENARYPQLIGAVIIFPNYSLIYPPPDTSRKNLFVFDGYLIGDTVKDYSPKTLVSPLTYRVGSLYNLNEHNNTLNRYINMGQFKFVKSRYESTSDSFASKRMNVYYYLTPLKKRNFNAELAAFTKSNSFYGGQVNINWKNRNLFKGAEQLNVKMYGAIETSSVDTLRANNNFRVGSEISLTVPRFVTPFRLKESKYSLPMTKFIIGYEWVRRQQLYTKNYIRTQYELNWKENAKIEHTLTPISITYNNATEFSPEYLAKINKYAVLSYAVLPEIIAGASYNFSFSTNNPREKNIFFFNGNIDLVGNIAGLVTQPQYAFSKKIAGAYFAQYIKSDIELRYTRKISTNVYWSNRFNIGIGLPYGNSSYLPFSRQFVIGGSNSLRGFVPRQLGPGRVLTTPEQQISYPVIGGDYKLEIQTELRFPLFSKFRGALFVDAGNIWTKNNLIFGEEARLSSQFLSDLAVDGGIGIRYDIDVLIIRLDLGIPLRKPWMPRGSEWVFDQIKFGDGDWRQHNMVLNIGVGYPF
jgi:outer membrane protein insertion porin family